MCADVSDIFCVHWPSLPNYEVCNHIKVGDAKLYKGDYKVNPRGKICKSLQWGGLHF